MSESLEERLKKNSSAFDGLLSLIPSKYYYDEDTQNQWKQKKQSKEQMKKNKKLKLDPSNDENKSLSAGELSKKKAKNAKPVTIPGSSLKGKLQSNDKAKGVVAEESKEGEESDGQAFQESDSEDGEDEEEEGGEEEENVSDGNAKSKSKKNKAKEDKGPSLIKTNEEITLVYDDEGNEIELSSSSDKAAKQQKAAATTTSNGTVKEATPEEKQKKKENLNKLKERLQQKIELMKAKRKAPGSKAPGAPKSREQILEERRKKKEQRDLKRKSDVLDEDEEEDEEAEKDDVQSESDSDSENEESGKQGDEAGSDVLFQNIVFNDGARTTSDLTKLRELKKKKGPANRDIKAHLKKVQQRKEKLEQLDAEKRKEAQDKDQWSRVLLQAEGVKVKDDEKLLKKALKNKERQKRKSENQWYERKLNVKKNVQDRLKRRDENLQIRKENKGVKRKNQKKQLRKFQGPRAKKSKKSKAGF